MFSLFKPSFEKLQKLVLADDDDALYAYGQKHKGVLDTKNESGLTLLMLAIKEKKYLATEAIIISDIDINAVEFHNLEHRTALDYAVREEETPHKIFELLLEAGANAVTENHFLPVSYPLMRKDFVLAQLLFNHGARANGLLVNTIEEGAFDEAEFILKNGGDVTERDAEGRNPLMHAIMQDKDPLVKLLIEAGTDATRKDNAGQTTLNYTKNSSKETVDLIFKSALAE